MTKKLSLATQPTVDAYEAIATGQSGDPFACLGMHKTNGAISVTAFDPGAESAEVIDADSGKSAGPLEKVHPAGVFSAKLRRRKHFPYRLRFSSGSEQWEVEDPYRFGPVLGELDVHLLAEGNHLDLYKRLGAHPMVHEGVEGTAFAVWAPNARRVSVIGAFNFWDGRRHPMRMRHEAGVWELFVPGVKAGELYKFEIIGAYGHRLPLKSDPMSFAQEHPPETASRVHGLPEHDWSDGDWLERRAEAHDRSRPISIYEVHLGSWRRAEGERMLSYDELGDELIPYVQEMGFTHIECMPVSEFPFAGSWGYQPIGLFAPTSRFGPPEGFARFVDRCHEADIGVIVDWVPAHFPSDEHGLAQFDGTALYEHADPRKGFHKDWNTLIYNFGRREVMNFLVANALFWLDRFHVDALRVDAVASMLYLDYSRNEGEWEPNVHGGRENLEAIHFLKEMNRLAFGTYPGITTIAEESTAWPGVSRPVDQGGLGFGYKWNMGWMHDTLQFMSKEPVHRKHHQHQLTFGLHYAFSENFVLPLSHDEVVHGKGSLIGKMPGDRWQKFANLRAYFSFMWTHPGKKLLFMGGEFAQEREWNHDVSLDWHLASDHLHGGVQRLVRDLNHLYRELPALHALDCEEAGFQWIDNTDSEQSVLSYMRRGHGGDAPTVIICNFTPVVRTNYRVGLPRGGAWRERLNSDAEIYGGSGIGNGGRVQAEDVPCQGQPCSAAFTLPPLGVLVLTPENR